ncbi:MAG TPA: hypothetical protein VFS59_16700, partial [Gemmatimonadaceae bacterium]|nr:hypothetical protein [Gemmatimonadaceae bacterium]
GAVADARRVARDALRVSMALIPLAALVAGMGDEIVRVVFGTSFAGAGVLLALLFAAGVALVVMSVAVSVITAADAQGVVSLLGVGVLGGAVAGHLVLIPRFGAVGAAMVTATASVAGGLASVLLVHRLWDVRAYATLLRAALIAGPAYWLATQAPTLGLLGLLTKVVVLTTFVVGAFLALGELDPDERRRVRAAWPRRRLANAESE